MFSMKVAIIDDNPNICQQIREYLTAYCIHSDIEMKKPDIYHNCESLFQAFLSGAHYDVLFLDVDFNDGGHAPDFSKDRQADTADHMNGIELGVTLRNIFGSNLAEIIYVTSYEEYAMRAIPVRPAAFIHKPVTMDNLTSAMQEVEHFHQRSNRIFSFTHNKSVTCIQVSRIQYLNSSGRQIYVKLVDGKVSFYGKLSEIEAKKCFSSFIRIHKSYLVNPDYIERYTSNSVYLHGIVPEVLPISRAHHAHVEEHLLRRQ